MLGPPIPPFAQEARLAVLQQQQLQQQLQSLKAGLPSLGMRPPPTALELAVFKNTPPSFQAPFQKHSSTLPFASPEWFAAVAAEREAERAVNPFANGGPAAAPSWTPTTTFPSWTPPAQTDPPAPVVSVNLPLGPPALVAGAVVFWAVKEAAGAIIAYETTEAWKDFKSRGLKAMKGKLEYSVPHNHMLIRFEDGRTTLAPRKYQPW